MLHRLNTLELSRSQRGTFTSYFSLATMENCSHDSTSLGTGSLAAFLKQVWWQRPSSPLPPPQTPSTVDSVLQHWAPLLGDPPNYPEEQLPHFGGLTERRNLKQTDEII